MSKVTYQFTKILKNLFSHAYFWLALLVGLYFLPMLMFPGFSYIDDGHTLLISKKILDAPLTEWPDYLFESHIGRMRPMYYLYFVFLYLLVGPSAFWFWFFQAVVFLLFLIGIYKLTVNNKKTSIIHLLLILVFMLLPEVIENTYRLGPAEIRQALFLVWFLVWLKRFWKRAPSGREILVANLFFAGAILTKETAIILFPLFMTYFISGIYIERQLLRSKLMWILFSTLSLQTIIFFLVLPAQQGYASGFQFSAGGVWRQILVSRLQAAQYYLLLSAAGILTAIRLLIASKKQQLGQFFHSFTWQAMYSLGLLGSLIFVFSWKHQLGRYYYLTIIFIWLYLLSEIALFEKILPKLKQLSEETRIILTMITLGVFIGLHLSVFQGQGLQWNKITTRSYQTAYNWFRGYQTTGALTQYLYQSVPAGTQIYTTATDYEPVIDMAYFASRFGDRDIRLYSANPLAEKNHPETQRYTEDVLAAYNEASAPKLLIVSVLTEGVAESDKFMILRPKRNILEHESARFWRIQEVYE
jgi:hypothetical protein